MREATSIAAPRLPEGLDRALKQRRLPALDGLRAIAALFVVAYHFGMRAAPAGLGVLIFFVLSGFLITWLLLVEQDRTGTVSLRAFHARRVLRIVPAFWGYWLVFIGSMLIFGKSIHWTQAAASFVFLGNYYQALFGDPNTGLSHAWTLGVEQQFYLLWPPLFVLLGRNRPRMARILLWLIPCFWAYRLLMVLVVGVPQGYVYEAFDMRADHFLAGCLLAIALRSGVGTRLVRAVTARPELGVLTVMLVAVSVAFELEGGVLYRDTVGHIVNPVLTVILLTQALTFYATPLWGWLEWSWVRYLGQISYSIYLYQQLVIPVTKKLFGSLPWPLDFLLTCGAIVLAASASYVFIERPVQEWGKKRGRKAPAPALPPAPLPESVPPGPPQPASPATPGT
jgi:peptidoglycan/LPS O-acetylase OafA/YrhL